MKRIVASLVMFVSGIHWLAALGGSCGQPLYGNTVDAGANSAVAWMPGIDGIEIKNIEVKGSIVPDGTVLYYSGGGIWQNKVSLDKPVAGDYRNHNIYFTINGVDSLSIYRIPGTSNLIMPSQNGKREPIRLNNGVYDITLDLNKQEYSISAEVNPYKISVFGSSVANGQGATDFNGYAYLYGQQLEKRFDEGESIYPFQISGVSIGGNTTVKLLKRYDDLINDFGHYVMIGLSLGNEGIHDADEPEKVFEQFSSNMQTLIARVREAGKEPIVVNNYTRGDYNERDYSYIRRMNLMIHQWDVPSVNVLGAIDDGAGHWAEGYIADRAHPNTEGHGEFMYAIVPSLFDALACHKSLPERDMSQSYRLTDGKVIALTPEGSVHPFTVSMRIKGSESGKLLMFGHGADKQSAGHISVDGDRITYLSPVAGQISTTGNVLSDGKWHDVTLTHYYALGKTILYIDDIQIGEINERLLIGDITIGDEENTLASRWISEIFFWRSALSRDEISAHHSGAMLKSSLELYSPLDPHGYILENRAQSMNRAVFKQD